MHILYYHPSCPLSKQARIYLEECDINFDMIIQEYWQKDPKFVNINPSGSLPVIALTEYHQQFLIGIYPIIEYMVDTVNDFYFIDKNPVTRAKIRQYIHWFNSKFYQEVTKVIVNEKLIRLLTKQGGPRSQFIMVAKSNLIKHFQLLSNILTYNTYISSESVSCADIAAACNIGVIDYFGEINWNRWGKIKEWYCIIKSRPSFQKILQDTIPGFVPPQHYRSLDF